MVNLLCLKRWPTFQPAHQSQSTLKMINNDINMEARPQAGETIQAKDSVTARCFAEDRCRNVTETCPFAIFKAV